MREFRSIIIFFSFINEISFSMRHRRTDQHRDMVHSINNIGWMKLLLLLALSIYYRNAWAQFISSMIQVWIFYRLLMWYKIENNTSFLQILAFWHLERTEHYVKLNLFKIWMWPAMSSANITWDIIFIVAKRCVTKANYSRHTYYVQKFIRGIHWMMVKFISISQIMVFLISWISFSIFFYRFTQIIRQFEILTFQFGSAGQRSQWIYSGHWFKSFTFARWL